MRFVSMYKVQLLPDSYQQTAILPAGLEYWIQLGCLVTREIVGCEYHQDVLDAKKSTCNEGAMGEGETNQDTNRRTTPDMKRHFQVQAMLSEEGRRGCRWRKGPESQDSRNLKGWTSSP